MGLSYFLSLFSCQGPGSSLLESKKPDAHYHFSSHRRFLFLYLQLSSVPASPPQLRSSFKLVYYTDSKLPVKGFRNLFYHQLPPPLPQGHKYYHTLLLCQAPGGQKSLLVLPEIRIDQLGCY